MNDEKMKEIFVDINYKNTLWLRRGFVIACFLITYALMLYDRINVPSPVDFYYLMLVGYLPLIPFFVSYLGVKIVSRFDYRLLPSKKLNSALLFVIGIIICLLAYFFLYIIWLLMLLLFNLLADLGDGII